jgi:hypothetical protein
MEIKIHGQNVGFVQDLCPNTIYCPELTVILWKATKEVEDANELHEKTIQKRKYTVPLMTLGQLFAVLWDSQSRQM